MEKAQI